MVSSSCSTTTSVLPFALELRERVEQDAVVARMQADGRLVEDVADAAQVRAELRREPDALRFAAGERRRGAVERRGSRGPRARGSRGAQCSSVRMSRAISASRPATASFSKNVSAFEIGCALMSAIDWSRKRTASASRLRRLPSHSGQASSISSHSTQESSTWSSVPVFERSSSHFTSSILRPVP